MNIEILQDHIETFTREVVDSGFKRDLDDYTTSLPNAQNNIVTLRDIAGKVLSTLDSLYEGDLPDALRTLLPGKDIQPFTDSPHEENLRNLIEDTEVAQQGFYSQLNQQLVQLKKQIQQNISKIDNIKGFIAPYLSRDTAILSEQGVATISIAFKEQHTITNLNQFTKTLHEWNRTLPVYHQLLKSESPKDIRIVEVQNGSIDFVLNLDLDVALDLVKLFNVGFKCYVAYLSYKKLIEPIAETYYGNKKLLDGEKEREKELLDNIGTAVKSKVIEQHKEAKKRDTEIDATSISKKVKMIMGLVTDHIIKGNDIKLLAVPQTDDDEQEEKEQTLSNELRAYSIKARSKLRLLPAEEKQKLLDRYSSDQEKPANED